MPWHALCWIVLSEKWGKKAARGPEGPAIHDRNPERSPTKLLRQRQGQVPRPLLIGITFAVFLMIQMTSMFAGMMRKASATVDQHRRQDLGDGPLP